MKTNVAPVTPVVNAVANLTHSEKEKSVEEKESAFKAEYGQDPDYFTSNSGRLFSVEICNAKIPTKECGYSLADAKLAALKKALRDMEDA